MKAVFYYVRHRFVPALTAIFASMCCAALYFYIDLWALLAGLMAVIGYGAFETPAEGRWSSRAEYASVAAVVALAIFCVYLLPAVLLGAAIRFAGGDSMIARAIQAVVAAFLIGSGLRRIVLISAGRMINPGRGVFETIKLALVRGGEIRLGKIKLATKLFIGAIVSYIPSGIVVAIIKNVFSGFSAIDAGGWEAPVAIAISCGFFSILYAAHLPNLASPPDAS